jgi:WD40 repeat protein
VEPDRQAPAASRGAEENLITTSPTGDALISGTYAGTIEVWSTHDWSHRTLLGTSRSLTELEVLPDGSAIVLCDSSGTVWLRPLDGSPERRIARLPHQVRYLYPSADSLRVGAFDSLGVVTIVDLRSGATWRLSDPRGLFDDLASGGVPASWVTVRGHELRFWNDDLPDEPEAVLARIHSTPEEVSEELAAPEK